MTLETIAVESQTDMLRGQIMNLVQQYADIVYTHNAFVPGETAVPVSGKVVGAKELQLMVDASLDGWLTTGRFNKMFLQDLQAYVLWED